jgi:Spy/CpxP family protein refolding chaperone
MKPAWKSLIVVGVVVVFTGGLAVAGFGGGPGWGRGRGMGFGPQARGPVGPAGEGGFGPLGAIAEGRLGPVARRLNLTEDQLDKIRDIFRQARANAETAADAVVRAREALHEAVIGGSNEAAIRAAAKTLGEAISDQAVLRARTVAAARAVLTDEQRETLQNVRENQPAVRPGMRGMGRGPGLGRGPRAGSAGPDGNVGPMDRGPVPLEQMFQAADADKDGTLTMEELQAYRNARRDARQSQRP